MKEPTYLTAVEVAERLRVSVLTLANWRVLGKGPAYVKIGSKVLYPIDTLEEWELARRGEAQARHSARRESFAG
jgi:hypothetical protein